MAAVNTTSYPVNTVQSPGSALKPDSTALFGQIGRVENIKTMTLKDIIAVAIGSSTTPTLTAAQFVSNLWDISGSPGGGVTLNTPTAAAIIAALPVTIPQDGTFNFDIMCQNDATGQTLTVTGGTGVTVLGTATVANNTTRIYRVNVNVSAATVTMLNLGTMSL